MRLVQIVWNPLHRSQQMLGAVTLHDVRDQKHVMGCPRCQKLPNSPDSGSYTVPFWDAYEKEQEKWHRS